MRELVLLAVLLAAVRVGARQARGLELGLELLQLRAHAVYESAKARINEIPTQRESSRCDGADDEAQSRRTRADGQQVTAAPERPCRATEALCLARRRPPRIHGWTDRSADGLRSVESADGGGLRRRKTGAQPPAQTSNARLRTAAGSGSAKLRVKPSSSSASARWLWRSAGTQQELRTIAQRSAARRSGEKSREPTCTAPRDWPLSAPRLCPRNVREACVSTAPASAKMSTEASTSRRRSRFRPCIDLHAGQVKQIVGGTLTDDATDGRLRTNFIAACASSCPASLSVQASAESFRAALSRSSLDRRACHQAGTGQRRCGR